MQVNAIQRSSIKFGELAVHPRVFAALAKNPDLRTDEERGRADAYLALRDGIDSYLKTNANNPRFYDANYHLDTYMASGLGYEDPAFALYKEVHVGGNRVGHTPSFRQDRQNLTASVIAKHFPAEKVAQKLEEEINRFHKQA